MKTTATQRKQQALITILLAVSFLWLTLLTKFAIDSRTQQMWQAKNDSEAIFKLMTEQSKQQVKLEEMNR